MKRLSLATGLSIAIVALAAPAWAQTAAYTVNPAAPGSLMELRVYKTGIYSGKVHTFLFRQFGGELAYDAAHPEASKIELTIQTASFELTDDWLDAGDRKDVIQEAEEKVLEVKKYPQMKFVSSSIRAVGGGKYEVAGSLTIRNKLAPSKVMVTMEPQPDGSLKFTGTSVVTMTDYGIKPPRVFFGVVGTKDDMDFRFTLTARSQQSSP